MKTYQKYKNSGIRWLGSMPSHWELKKLKWTANYCVSNVDKVPAENEDPVKLCNYTDVYYYDFISPNMELMETTATKEEIQRFHLKKDDVVITKDSEEWDDIAISALVTETSPNLVCGYHLAIIRSNKKELIGKYLHRLMQAVEINRQFQVAATGVTRYGLPKDAIGQALILLPPLPEQLSIAAFLDRETSRIDGLIARKKRQIELLQKKRTALISQAVTKGLDPKVKMKDSGVAWLGEVPSHWEISKVGYCCDLDVGYAFESDKFVDYGIRLLRGDNVTEGTTRWEEKSRYWLESESVPKRFLLAENDLVISMDGSKVGKNYALIKKDDLPAFLVQRVARLRAKVGLKIHFLYWWIGLPWFKQWVDLVKTDPAIPHITAKNILDYQFVLPPISEQLVIAAFLDRETAHITSLVSKIELSIRRLADYRTALISAAVTGKIDVREEAAA
jgi:type I restriction enzyme, S subunit